MVYSSSNSGAVSTGYITAVSTTTAVSTEAVWSTWSNNYYASTVTATTSGTTWTAWNNYYTSTASAITTGGIHLPAWRDTRTPQQIADARKLRLVAEGEMAAARDRAAKLLQEALSEKQRLELRDRGFFTLQTIRPNGERRTYRIHRGRSQNVRQVDEQGNTLKVLCAHPIMLVPDEDTMLAQKLMLETMEDEFLRVANHSLPFRARA